MSFCIFYNTEDILQYISDWRKIQDVVVSLFIINLRYIENNHGSGKVVISKESEQILVQSGSRIPSQTILGKKYMFQMDITSGFVR